MVLITSSGPETLKPGFPAPDFSLPGTDGKTYSLASFSKARALVIAFTCNHCPYAQANEGRFKSLVDRFSSEGAMFVAINPNNDVTHPEDSFQEMKRRAKAQGFNYPYLRDELQTTARAYGAVCTPHYFVFDSNHRLAYEGRLDDNWQKPDLVKKRELEDAITAVLAAQPVLVATGNPMGCSIKWK